MKKLKRSHVSEVNLLTLLDEYTVVNWQKLEKIDEEFYTLKEGSEYNSKRFILNRIEEKNLLVMHFNIPLLLNNCSFSKVDTEKVFDVEMLVQEEVGFGILYSPLFSFKYEGFESVDCDFQNYIETIENIQNFEIVEQNEFSITYENSEKEIQYTIFDARKQAEIKIENPLKYYPSGHLIKHELYFKNPYKFFEREVRFAHLEHNKFLKECKRCLRSVVKSIEFKDMLAF